MAVITDAEPSDETTTTTTHVDHEQVDDDTSTPLLTLTPAQERRLRDHLDLKLLTLERDARKHRLAPLHALISRLTPILHLTLQIPPTPDHAPTRVAYFLAFTSTLIAYITSLPLIDLGSVPSGPLDASEPACAAAEQEAGDTMRATLDFLGEVQDGWIAVLRGKGYAPPADTEEDAGGSGTGRGTVFDMPGAQVGAVDQTARVRLRSMVMLGREKFLAWARPYGDFGGEVMSADMEDEGEMVPVEATVGWEAEVTGLWTGILSELDKWSEEVDVDDESEDVMEEVQVVC